MGLKQILVIAVFIAVLYNLGAALYYMMVDKGASKRTVNSLTWRIGLSVALIVLVALGLLTGVLESNGIRVGR